MPSERVSELAFFSCFFAVDGERLIDRLLVFFSFDCIPEIHFLFTDYSNFVIT